MTESTTQLLKRTADAVTRLASGRWWDALSWHIIIGVAMGLVLGVTILFGLAWALAAVGLPITWPGA